MTIHDSSDGTEYKREIARIESTTLGFEDHGIFTSYLHVTYGGTAQGIGGYSLQAGRGDEFIMRTLRACGVDSWEQLKGRTIFVLTDPATRRVEGIENLPTERGEQFVFADLWSGVE